MQEVLVCGPSPPEWGENGWKEGWEWGGNGGLLKIREPSLGHTPDLSFCWSSWSRWLLGPFSSSSACGPYPCPCHESLSISAYIMQCCLCTHSSFSWLHCCCCCFTLCQKNSNHTWPCHFVTHLICLGVEKDNGWFNILLMHSKTWNDNPSCTVN